MSTSEIVGVGVFLSKDYKKTKKVQSKVQHIGKSAKNCFSPTAPPRLLVAKFGIIE